MDGIIAYILSKKYTNNTVIGMGAIKGAACQVQSINKVGKTTTVTLKWEDNTGGIHTQAFDIEDGIDGVSVQNATIKPNGHLELTLSNGITIDCGKVLPQYDTMPTPSASNEGQILQYIGTTTSNYTNGYFYECINDGGTYKWVEKLVQDSYTKIQIGDLTNLPDNTKNVVQNIGDLKLSIDQLSASKLSKTDIDNVLSTTSENPVQNKVITDALNNKENKFRVTLIPIASASDVGKIIQYIGSNTSSLTSGYYYQCVEVSTGVYDWVQKNVQPSSGGTGGDGVVDGYYNSTDQLFYEDIAHTNPVSGDSNTLYVSVDTNLVYRFNGTIFIRVDEVVGEDDVINGYYNTTDGKFYEDSAYTTEITGETGKIYISIDTNIQYRWDNISLPNKFVTISSSIDVDNTLSIASENPVQNKVITLAIDQLQGSVLNKIQKKLSANADDFAIFTNDGDIADSGISKDIVPTNASASNKLLVISDISEKADKVSGATNDDFATLDSNGNLKDSGINKNIIPTTATSSNKLATIADIPDELNDLNDVVITSPVNKQILAYNSTSGKWENQTGQETIGGIVPKGSILFANLPTTGMSNGDAYDIKDAFVTDNRFEEGSGIECGAGTDIVWIADENKWNILTPSGVYSFNGRTGAVLPATSDYDAEQIDYDNTTSGLTATDVQDAIDENASDISSHIGNTSNPHNVTATQIGLSNVVNTGDSDIPVSGGTTKFTTGGAYTELNKKADKVSGATNGNLAGLDANGNLTDSGVVANNVIEKVATATGLLKDDGAVDTTNYAPSNKAYLTDDTIENTIDNADYFPFYDSSANTKKKTLWSNIKEKLTLQWENPYT